MKKGKKKTVLYYISSHGFGHAARSGQVIKELIREYRVIVKTTVPKWLITQVVENEIVIYPDQFDVGCIQVTNVTIDTEKTFSTYRNRSKINKTILDKECAFIKKNKIDFIISDIASFPFVVAKKACIPSLFIGNFTWKGIYQYLDKSKSGDILKELEYEYSLALNALTTPLSIDMPELKNKKRINFIARKGENIRSRLNEELKIISTDKLVFFYAGNGGTEKADHKVIRRIKGYTFISFYPLSTSIKNYIYLKPGSFRHQDIMASSDIALVKPGYGMVSEAMVNAVPIVYPPREDFIEYYAFVKEFELSGGTIAIGKEDFERGNWLEALRLTENLKYKKKYRPAGAIQTVAMVKKILSSTH